MGGSLKVKPKGKKKKKSTKFAWRRLGMLVEKLQASRLPPKISSTRRGKAEESQRLR